jgi:hypothetical protein
MSTYKLPEHDAIITEYTDTYELFRMVWNWTLSKEILDLGTPVYYVRIPISPDIKRINNLREWLDNHSESRYVGVCIGGSFWFSDYATALEFALTWK